MKSADAVRDWNQAWIDGFSGADIEIVSCIGAGEWTVARFSGRGTNDGRFGSFEPTNQRVQLDVCHLARWQDGRIVEQHAYYDLYGFPAQLGHAPQRPMAGARSSGFSRGRRQNPAKPGG